MTSPKDLYRFHVKNLRSVSAGLDHVFRSARDAIARSDSTVIDTHIRLLSFLLGVWSEVRLLKILHEPNGFSQAQRECISKDSALQRWLLAVELAFRKRYKIPKAALRPPRLPSTAHFRFRTLTETLENELSGIITIRNKLAHGQWVYPLTKEMDRVATDQMRALNQENILSLTSKRRLVEILCEIVHDLIVSKPTFDRDWDKHFRRFEQTRTNLRRKEYQKWQGHIRARYRRGQRKRLTEYTRLLSGAPRVQE